MACLWQADDGSFIVVFRSSLPSSTKKKKKRRSWIPPDKTFWIRACCSLTKSVRGPVGQLVGTPAVDLGVASLILAQSHTFAEIDHEIIFYGHSSPSSDSRKLLVS